MTRRQWFGLFTGGGAAAAAGCASRSIGDDYEAALTIPLVAPADLRMSTITVMVDVVNQHTRDIAALRRAAVGRSRW